MESQPPKLFLYKSYTRWPSRDPPIILCRAEPANRFLKSGCTTRCAAIANTPSDTPTRLYTRAAHHPTRAPRTRRVTGRQMSSRWPLAPPDPTQRRRRRQSTENRPSTAPPPPPQPAPPIAAPTAGPSAEPHQMGVLDRTAVEAPQNGSAFSS